MTDNNPLTYVLTSAELDAPGQRWVAAMSAYNFNLTYRIGIKNADTDGLSRKAPENTECMKFPEVLKAVTNSVCATSQIPYVQTLASTVSPDVTDIEQEVPPELLAATALKGTDWKRTQFDDQTISKILEHIALGQRPPALQVEASKLDNRFLRECGKFCIENGILLRESVQQGQKVKQLVVQEKLRSDMVKAFHADLGHKGRERTLSLMKRRLY